MKVTIDVEKTVAEFRKFLLEQAVKDNPPVIPDNAKKLSGYEWEDSDSYPGQSYVWLPTGMAAKSAAINKIALHRQEQDMTLRGRELWYGPRKSSFSGVARIKVITLDGNVYVDSVRLSGGGSPDKTEEGAYHGRHNNDRPTWYFSKKMKAYPRRLRVVIDGCLNREITHNGHRYDSGGLIVKQSDVSGRGMAVVFSSSCKSKTCRIKY